jgi:hypothetical protein
MPVIVRIRERPSVTIAAAVNEIWEGQRVEYTASISNGVTLPDDIHITLSPDRGTTILSGDYVMPRTVTIPAGQNTATFIISLPVNNILDTNRVLIITGSNSIYTIKGSTLLIHDSTSLRPENKIITILNDTIFGAGTEQIVMKLPKGITTSGKITVNLFPTTGTTASNSDYTIDMAGQIPAGGNEGQFTVTGKSSSAKVEKLVVGGISTGFMVNNGTVTIFPARISVNPLVSANGDGINDYFQIIGIEKYQGAGGSNDVTIFNRWGDVIYNAKNYDNAIIRFSGRGNQAQAALVPDGVYFYIINITIPAQNLLPGEPAQQRFTGYLKLRH